MVLLVPFISILVLPIAWLEGRLLPTAPWVAILILVNAPLLYLPWVIAIAGTQHSMIGLLVVLGFIMVGVGLSFADLGLGCSWTIYILVALDVLLSSTGEGCYPLSIFDLSPLLPKSTPQSSFSNFGVEHCSVIE